MASNAYKPIEECRQEIQDYAEKLQGGSDDHDPLARSSNSTRRYLQDIRWFDEWMDSKGLENVSDLTKGKAHNLGTSLSIEFNGPTGRYRWDRIYKMYEWFRHMDDTGVKKNPMDAWNDDKDEEWTLTKTTEQEKRLEKGENYAPTKEEIDLLLQHVPAPRLVNQLCIKILWQTGIRRNECAQITLDMIDREKREIRLAEWITKNGKARTVAYQPSLDGMMAAWLDDGERDERLRGKDSDRLFVGPRGGKWDGQHINDIVIEAAKNAGLNRVLYEDALGRKRWKFSAHAIRHGHGTYMGQKTDCGLWELSQLLGHHSVSVTESLYIEDDDEAGLNHGHKYGPD